MGAGPQTCLNKLYGMNGFYGKINSTLSQFCKTFSCSLAKSEASSRGVGKQFLWDQLSSPTHPRNQQIRFQNIVIAIFSLKFFVQHRYILIFYHFKISTWPLPPRNQIRRRRPCELYVHHTFPLPLPVKIYWPRRSKDPVTQGSIPWSSSAGIFLIVPFIFIKIAGFFKVKTRNSVLQSKKLHYIKQRNYIKTSGFSCMPG